MISQEPRCYDCGGELIAPHEKCPHCGSEQASTAPVDRKPSELASLRALNRELVGALEGASSQLALLAIAVDANDPAKELAVRIKDIDAVFRDALKKVKEAGDE